NKKKKATAVTRGAPASAKQKAREEVPFSLKGMTDDFSPPLPKGQPEKLKREDAPAPKKAASPPVDKFKNADDQFTLTIDLNSSKNGEADKKNTAAVHKLSRDLESQRREKVKQFMENSNFENKDFDFGDDDKSEIKKTFGFNTKAEITSDKRKSKKSFQRAKKEKEQDVPDYGDNEGEFNSLRDIMDVSEDISSIKKSLVIRTIATGVLFLVLFYLALCNLYPLPLLSMLCPENNMKVYLILNIGVLLISAMFSNSVIGNGLVSLFTLKADNDSPAALAVIVAIAHGALAVTKEGFIYTGESHIYFSVVALILFMNSMGKLLMILRISRNFKIASCGKPLMGEYILQDDGMAAMLTEGQGLEDIKVAYGKKVSFPTDFMKLSYTDDYFENSGRIITPLFLGFGILLSLLSVLLFGNTWGQALTVLCVVLCMASPITGTLIGSLPLWQASKQLSGEGVFISGYESVDTFENLNAIVLDEKELYSDVGMVLHGIKAFGEGRVDTIIVQAASLMNKSDGLLKEVFLDVIERKLSMLREVTNVSFYDGGVGGVVDGIPVLMGSRELMQRFSIETPSRDYEEKFLKDDRSIIYLSAQGELTAMIVASYAPNEDAVYYINKLRRRESALIIKTADPNITPQRISKDFDYPSEYVTIVPEKLYKPLNELRAPVERAPALSMSTGIASRLRGICALVNLKHSIVTATVLQMTGLILGYAIVALLTFTGKIQLLGFLQLMIYELFWGIAIIMFSGFGRY
ncbi:MAG: hypothetical protein RRY40_00545, partial [Oscillospiraceae bacterium]